MGGALLRAGAFLSLAAVLLSGCQVPFLGDAGDGSFARHVAFQVGPDLLLREPDPERPEQFAADAADVAFTYTHEKGDVDVSKASVTYTTEQGTERTVPVERLTTLKTLKAGDSFEVTGVAMTSGIVLKADGDVVASRRGVEADWLTAGGYALPIDPDEGSRAAWRMNSSFDVRAGFDRFSITETEYSQERVCGPGAKPTDPQVCHYEERATDVTTTLTGALLEASLGMKGTFSIATARDTPDLSLAVDGSVDGELLADVLIAMTSSQDGEAGESESFRTGIDAAIDVTFGGEVQGQFDESRALQGGEAAGHARADGHVYLWDDSHSKAEKWEPEGIQHPFFDVEGSGSEDLEEQDVVVPGMAAFLERLWSVGLAPGDEFVLETDPGDSMVPFHVSQTMRVSGPETLHVAGHKFDALRVDASMAFDGGDGPIALRGFDVDLGTMWLDRETYLPLRSVMTLDVEFTQDDLAPVFALAAAFSGEDIEAPVGMHFSMHIGSTLELTSLQGDIQASAAWVAAPFFLAPIAAAFGTASGLDEDFE